MKQFWSLILMILAGCLLIFGSEYSLQGDYHRRIHQAFLTHHSQTCQANALFNDDYHNQSVAISNGELL